MPLNWRIKLSKSGEIFLYERNINKQYDFNMWFVFPGTESFALSSLGYLWLYHLVDKMEDVNIERIYSDTKSTHIHRDKVDLIGFSMSFDMDFMHVLSFLKKNKFEYRAKDRTEEEPLLYAGGPVITANPEPYKNIFDFFVIGDGEDLNTEIVRFCAENKNLPKADKLEILSKMDGVYVPSVKQEKIVKRTKKLSECIYTPIISNKSFFKNTFILEVERGCANRCGFCLASYLNLPIRFVSYEQLIDIIELGLSKTQKIALLGAQVTAHPDFEKVCEYIHTKIKNGQKIELGVSSLRVDSFKPEIVQTLVDAGQKNLTLAIEAGSERLRRVINKNLTEEQIFKAIDVAKTCGLRGLKFYGMIGLPTETQEDIDEIVTLSKRIKAKHKGFGVTFGFSTFVPKPNTPFQWFGRTDEKILEGRANYLKKELHKLGIHATISSSKWDYWQAVLSRGDEKLSDFIIDVYKHGGKLGAFKKSAKELGIDTDYYAYQNYEYDKVLPWDFIVTKPGKEFLIKESQRLISC